MNLFTNPPSRIGSDSLKWAKYAERDTLPMWVADMDFAAPPAVLGALHERIEHGVFGYAQPPSSLLEAVCQHLAGEYAWSIEPQWLVWLPGLVTGLNIACRAVDGDVLTATPIYPPFLSAPHFSGRNTLRAPLGLDSQGWHWDKNALQKALTANSKLFLLCHPHNPVGRCWNRQELLDLADFAEQNDLIVCSDEIHCGLILDPEKRHIPFAALSPEAAKRSITLMAPSKTFNVPGLGCAFAIIPDSELRQRFEKVMYGIVPHVNLFGFTACEAAYRHGEAWRRDLLATLRQNRDALEVAVDAISGIKMQHVEATYLAWLDVRELGLDDPAAHFEGHGLGLSDGRDFAAPGWLRLNFGCSPATLATAIQRLAAAGAAV